MTDENDNFDDIDLNELFNDFDDTPTLSFPQSLPMKSSLPKFSDELIEFHENDCTAPRVIRPTRKVIKGKRKTVSKQTTMYEYAASVSYQHKEFYSSWDNSTTKQIITKGQKRSTQVFQCHCLVSIDVCFFLGHFFTNAEKKQNTRSTRFNRSSFRIFRSTESFYFD